MAEPGSSRVEARPRTPAHLWVVGVLALLWQLVGVFDYTATQMRVESYMAEFTEEQLAYFTGFPGWVIVAWTIAIWCGLFGAIALLLRRRWAVWLYGLSIVGLAVTSVYNFGLSEGVAVMGTAGVVFTVVIWIVTIALLLYARKMAARGILV